MACFDSVSTQIWIFSVGRGDAAIIRTGLNQGFILDMNATGFDPAGFIKRNLVPKLDWYQDPQGVDHKIAQAILSHPHSVSTERQANFQTKTVTGSWRLSISWHVRFLRRNRR